MRFPMLISAGIALLCGLSGSLLAAFFLPAVSVLVSDVKTEALSLSHGILTKMTLGTLILFALIVLLYLFKKWLLRGKPVHTTVTWDCGYTEPSPAMQYTASSFAQPVLILFKGLHGASSNIAGVSGLFPNTVVLSRQVKDGIMQYVYVPLVRAIVFISRIFSIMDTMRTQAGILLIVLTVSALLFWFLW
jgi:hypothetical protein